MTVANGTMAGWYKAGRLGDQKALAQFFPDLSEAGTAQSLNKVEFNTKLKVGEEFVSEHLAHLYPPKTVTPKRVKEWKYLLNLYNLYRGEFSYFMNQDKNCFALMHINMNVDNCWWWRDEENKLQLGALDWGGLSIAALHRQM